MSDSEKYITVLEGDQLAVAAKALSGSIISEPSKRYITALVQTDEGVQLAVKAYVLNGGGGGGGDVDYTKIVQKTSSMPAASSSNAGYVYMYQGETNQTYTHGYIYENQYAANYAGTIAFTPAGISVSDEDFSSFLNTWKQYLTTPTLVTNGTITYHADSDLWRMVMKDANNQQIGTLQLYQEDYEDSGFTFPANPQDGDTYSFTTTITEASSSYQWVRLDVQPSNSDVYVLPPATASTLGGVKVGENLTVEADGTLNATGGGNTFSEASLSMPTGSQALSDPDLYNYIKTLYDASTTTGTDYVLKPEATITGEKSVNITRKGIASGFTGTSYIDTGYKFNPGNNTWEVRCKFTAPNRNPISGDWFSPFGNARSDNTSFFAPLIFQYNTSSWNLYSVIIGIVGGTRTVIVDSSIATSIFYPNKEYYLSCKWTGSNLIYSKYQNGSWSTIKSQSLSTAFHATTEYNISTLIGTYDATTSASETLYFPGTVDLPSFELYVNDALVYSPVNSLPYKKLATGSNVVDVSYKTIVEQTAQSKGSALYYIIDTANQTITLPKGDLFGFITQAIEKGE